MRVTSAEGGEEEDASCSQDDGDLPTAPSEQPTSARGAHREAAPPTARGEQRSVEEQVGWGEGAILIQTPLLYAHQTQRSRSNESQWHRLSVTICRLNRSFTRHRG